MDQALLHAFREGHILRSGENVGLLDLCVYDSGSVVCHLAAVRAVRLISVIFRRVMGSCDHNARVAVIITGGKGKRRNRHQGIVDPYLDSICRQNACRVLCKYIALDTAVITDSHSLCAALCLYPVGKALRSLAHNIDIHTVGSCSQHAAETCGSEFQGNSETFFDLIVISADPGQLRFQIRIFQICFQPAFIIFLIHFYHSYHSFFDFFV